MRNTSCPALLTISHLSPSSLTSHMSTSASPSRGQQIETHRHTQSDSHGKLIQFFFVFFIFRRKGKKIFQKKLKSARRQAGGLLNQKEESDPAPVSVVPPDMSSLALSLTKEASVEEEEEGEEAESRDMAEVEGELENSPVEGPSEEPSGVLGVAVLSSAATFCCGGQDAEGKVKTVETEKSFVKSQTAGMEWILVRLTPILVFSYLENPSNIPLCFSPVPRRLSTGSPGSLMFVRLRVQPTAGKKKAAGGLQLGAAKNSYRREAWLTLSQERYRNRVVTNTRLQKVSSGARRRVRRLAYFFHRMWFNL